MKEVLKTIEAWRARIEHHPLHGWLVAEDDGVVPERKLWFSLYFTNFIMYFRELNLYHVGYRGAVRQDPRRAALTSHAQEDMTHSRLFMRDFKTLGWDTLLDWRPSEVFHWLFSSAVNEQLRRRTVTIAKLYIEAQDPVVRYAVVEAIEACGNALFRHTAQLALQYRQRTGQELVYWGAFHLNRETGHAVEQNEESLFAGLELTPQQRAEATWRASRAFELIDEQNSHMLQLAQETIAQGGFAHRREAAAPVDVVAEERSDAATGFWPERYDFPFWPLNPHATQRPLVETLQRCAAAVRTPDMVDFFAVDDVDEALARLRLMLLYFATDSTGTPTFYRYMVPYLQPVTVQERAINWIAQHFGSRSQLVYVDWRSLGLDDKLAWSVSRTLEFIYLDSASETHRDLRAIITHHIDVTTDPVQRYWTVVALKLMTGVYADACASLARMVEQKLGVALPYLTLKQIRRPRCTPDAAVAALQFETLALDRACVEQARVAIERIAEGARIRNEHMLASVRRGDYPEIGRMRLARAAQPAVQYPTAYITH